MTASKTITDDLRAQLTAIDEKQVALIEERDSISYSAVVERDRKSVARLAELNGQLNNLKNEAASIEAALRESTKRELAAAEAERDAKRCSDLRQADGLLDEAEKIAQEFDDALRAVRETAVAFEAKMIQVRRLTGTSPQHDAIRVFMYRAVRSALHQSPVHIDAIAPSERTALIPVFQSWAKSARVLIANTLKTAAREAA
jgi:hypothetical protein